MDWKLSTQTVSFSSFWYSNVSVGNCNRWNDTYCSWQFPIYDSVVFGCPVSFTLLNQRNLISVLTLKSNGFKCKGTGVLVFYFLYRFSFCVTLSFFKVRLSRGTGVYLKSIFSSIFLFIQSFFFFLFLLHRFKFIFYFIFLLL